MRKLKLFEEFEEEEGSLILPGDEDYDYVDMTDDDEFTTFRDEIFADFKYSSEKILDVIGLDNEIEWWENINAISQSKNDVELKKAVAETREFLSKYDVKQINAILNDE
jgi:hypothetical protein